MSTNTITMVPVAQLRPNPWNRKRFDPTKLQELADSLREQGVLQPIVVRENYLDVDAGSIDSAGWEIVAGERRWRAAELAGLLEIPAIVRVLNDLQVVELMTTENAQREDVHPLEEAEHYQFLIDHGNGAYDPPAIAAKIGKSVSHVYQRLQLAKLTPDAKQLFEAEKITAGHAVEIARLAPPLQEEALRHTCHRWGKGPIDDTVEAVVSVRDLRSWIHDELHLELKGAPWSTKDADLVPDAGACTSCPKRTGFQPELFPDVKRKDICTDRDCYWAKWVAWAEREQAVFEAKLGKSVTLLVDSYGLVPFKMRGTKGKNDWDVSQAKSATPGLVVWGERTGQLLKVRVRKPAPRTMSYTSGQASKAPSIEETKQREDVERTLLEEWALEFADAVLAIYNQLAFLPDEIAYNIACQLSHFDDWQRLDGQDEPVGSRRYSDLLKAIVEYLPGEWDRSGDHLPFGQPDPEDGEASRALIAFWVWRARDTDGLDDRIDEEITARVEALQTSAEEDETPTCSVCGCTDDAPCPGGCAWAEETMDGQLRCTSCAPAEAVS